MAIAWAGGGLELGGITAGGATVFAAGGVLSVDVKKWVAVNAATIPRRIKTGTRYLPMGVGGVLC